MYLGTQESYRKTKATLVKPILLLKFHISYKVKHFTNHGQSAIYPQLVDHDHCTPIFAIFVDNKNYEYNDWRTMNSDLLTTMSDIQSRTSLMQEFRYLAQACHVTCTMYV